MTHIARTIVGFALGVACLASMGAGALSGQAVAITNGEVHTVSGSVISGGTVVFQDGKITAVGRGVEIPSGARVIDASGKWVTPGLFDSNTSLGVVEIGAAPGTVDGSTADPGITAAFNVADGINPNSTLIPVTRVEGITRAIVAPGMGAFLIGGQSVLIDLGADRAADMISKNPVAMYAVLGATGGRYAGGSRAAAVLKLRQVFQDVRDYADNREAYNSGTRRDYALSRLDLEALIPVAAGEVPLVIAVNRASDILTVLRLESELGLDVVLSGALEGWMVAEDIAAAGVPVMTNPMVNLPTFEALGATYENVARMHAAGVTVILSSFDAHNVSNLKQAAGFAVSYGMPYDAALRSVTLTPAEVWGVQDEIGSLDVGKDADVVVWSGDPFEISTSVEHVFIQGGEISYETRQTLLFEKYRDLRGLYPKR